MDPLNKWTLLTVGILFHLAFTMSIFDIYFVSPLVHGMRHYLSTETPPAKRLFLVVGDGLRADKCFDNITHPVTGETGYLAPFIREKVLNEATFGISHTRVPTESRPGHVALIAGFYEDVSAVTKGWKENPVDFDSVFNQTRHTWSFGSPDILPMFADGASDPDRVSTEMYSSSSEDFTKGTIALDEFVFDNVNDLFARAQSDPELNRKLRGDKVVFFLHLLGIDTAGHGYRPYSPEYYDNIIYIDSEIRKLEKMINDFYKDDKTAWVFTSDHGMSDWGSHGDGHPDNTHTPLVVWGAGVPKPNRNAKGHHDGYSEPWDLNSVKRNDVNQADVASLMAYLIGINYPANSVGELPLDYIDASPETRARALSANAFAIAEQYLVKEAEAAESQLKFTPYTPLTDITVQERKDHIIQLIDEKQFVDAIEQSEELMSLSLAGLRYLQTYNWLFLRTLVTIGYLGWIGYAIASFLHTYVTPDERKSSHLTVRLTSLCILSALFWVFYFQRSPINYYLYALFPVFFWDQVIEHCGTIQRGTKLLIERQDSKTPVKSAIFIFIFTLVLLEAIVYGYFHRAIFSACFAVAILWPWVQDPSVAYSNLSLSGGWAVLCLAMASFTLLPVNKEEDITQILLAGFLMIGLGIYYTVHLGCSIPLPKSALYISGIQIGLIALAMAVTHSSVSALTARDGLPLGNQITGWGILVGSLVMPVFFRFFKTVSDYRFRLLTVFLTFAPTFVILTISSEGFFYVSFFALLQVWVELEYLFYGKRQNLSFSEFRLSVFFFYFIQIGFFGTGNIASIASFFLDSVRRLIGVFDPFAMGALLIFKILVPFALLSVSLGILNIRLEVPKSSLFTMVLCVCDILTLNFFYLVVDEGSWLDIGTGISHFSIASGLCFFMILLESLGDFLVSGVEVPKRADVSESKSK